jgi:hypothetical protein
LKRDQSPNLRPVMFSPVHTIVSNADAATKVILNMMFIDNYVSLKNTIYFFFLFP